MSLAETPDLPLARFVVRTLGEEPRTSRALAAGDRVEVGYALACDLVLRDLRADGCRIALRLGEATSVVEVLAGAVTLLGHTVRAPGQIILPAYVPLQVGGVALAFGEDGAARWADADDLLSAFQAGLQGGATPRVPAPAVRRGGLGGLPRPAAAVTVCLAFALLVGLAVLSVGAAARPALMTPAKVEQILRGAGLQGLKVEGSADRGLRVSGVLLNDAAVVRLTRVLADAGVTATFSIRTSDGLARQVEDVFRSGGVEATARPQGPGVVVVAVGGQADPLLVDQMVRRARRDLPGLRDLRFEAPTAPHPEAVGAAALQITEATPGPDGYLALTDGGKYFVGATLPTGQTLVAVREHQADLESGGVTTQLTF